MNLMTKALIVINLVFSSAFCVFSLSLYARQTDWVQINQGNLQKRNELQKQRDEFKAKFTEKDAAFGELSAKYTQERESMTKKIEELTAANGELTRKNADNDKLQQEWAQLSKSFDEKISVALKRAEDLESDRAKAVAERTQAVNDRQFAQKTALEVTSDLKETEEELIAATKRATELMEEVLQMRAMLDKIRTRVPDLATMLVETEDSAIAVHGKVVSVHEAVDLVMLNIGQNDKLKPGMKLVISRGDKYVGRVIVRNVYDNMASAVIDKPVMRLPIREGDVAETL